MGLFKVNGNIEAEKLLSTKQINIGANLDMYNAARAELSIVTVADNPGELWLGANSARIWSISARGSNESNILQVYNRIAGANAFTVATDNKVTFTQDVTAPTFSGSLSGNASTATKLAAARAIRTNLASTSTASFDGSANITPGVTGTLSVANGGTGRSTLTSGYALVGNGTSAVALRSITSLATSDSTALITSGGVYTATAQAITDISRSGTTFTATRANGTTFTFTQQDNNTTYGAFVKSGSTAAAGLVPKPSTTAGTTKYLCEDGTWKVPPDTNTTYSFSNKAATLAWGTTSTIATVGGVDITLTMPANPDTNTYGRTANTTSKIFLMGGTSQSASNKTTYSNVGCYASGGYLYSGSTKVSVEGHTHSYLPLSGGTLTGTLTTKGSVYTDDYTGALNMNNSNIYGLNGIYTADNAEGINFYRSATNVDSLWASTGVLYFTPNRPLGEAGTSYTVVHSGNYTSYQVNTDTKVTQSASTSTSWRPLLLHYTATSQGSDPSSATNLTYYTAKASIKPSTGQIYTAGGITSAGLITVTTNSNTVTIGSQNVSYCHIYNSANIPFIFNKSVQTMGAFCIYEMGAQGCGASFPSNPVKGQLFFKTS